jgi:hypothetical protein
MFPIVHNLNALASSVHQLKHELHEIKNSMGHISGASGSTHSSVPPEVVEDIKKLALQTTQGVSEVKKYVDAVKAEVTRDIGMLETMISRKCEVTMNKMINDKINIVLESQRSGSKDTVATIRDEFNNELSVQTRALHELKKQMDDTQKEMSAMRSELTEEREAVATALQGSVTLDNNKVVDDIKAVMSSDEDDILTSPIETRGGGKTSSSSKSSKAATIARRASKK